MGSNVFRTLVRPTLWGALAGATAAAALLLLDSVLHTGGVIPTGNARALLGAGFGSVVTVGAFSFWMRPVAAQLASTSVPPRLLAGHLYDRFQLRVVAATVGVLGFLAVVLLSLPRSSDAPAPLVSTFAGALLGVGAVASLLAAMRHAESSTRPSVVLAEAAHDVIAHIRSTAIDEPIDDPQVSPDQQPARVVATTSGWIRSVDLDGLLEAVPNGTTVRLDTEVGTFVISDWTTLASVWPEDAVDDAVRRRVTSCIEVGDERGAPLDLVGSMTQFVDVGVQAGSGSSASPSTVYEYLWWLGAVLHELAIHFDVGFPDRQRDDGRILLREQRLSTPAVAEMAVDRIRQVIAGTPEMALELLRVVLDAEAGARQRDRPELATVLRRQAGLIVEQCRRSDALPHDIERVVRARGLDDEETTVSRSDEYPTDHDGREIVPTTREEPVPDRR